MENWNHEKEQLKGLHKGHLLLSEPFMWDPNFSRTVILLTEHDEKGSLGLVQNRPVNLKLHETIEDFPESDFAVYYGGPCEENTLHFIHRLGDLIDGAEMIRNGLYYGGNYETVRILIEKHQLKNEDIKFFLGYSGWSAGQLEKEMQDNSWIVSDKFQLNKLLTEEGYQLWKTVMEEMGGVYKAMSHYPTNPQLN